MLTQRVFGLSSVTDIMKGLLLQMFRNTTNPEQLCVRFLGKRKKHAPLSLPSNMFYNLLLWFCVLYGFFFIIIFTKPVSNKCSHFAIHLAFGSATCPAWP